MIKLFTLKNVSPYAEDAVYKICLALDKFDLCEETAFENYDELTESALQALDQGQHIIIAAENGNYNQLKKAVISRLILEEQSSLTITECISRNADDDVAEIDMASHALVPSGSVCHLTLDGLFCGFTCNALSGRLTFMPLDFMRIDTVLEGFVSYLENGETASEEDTAAAEMPGYDFSKSVGKMVFALSEIKQRIALVTGEATMWIYNLYNEIPAITDVAAFVEIVDEQNEESEAEEATAQSESVKLVGKARDAMYNASCDIGGAISEIYSTDDEEGNKVYFAYVAVVDRSVAKAKKLSTSNPEDLELLLPHAVTLLCETISQRAKNVTSSLAKTEYEDEEEQQEAAPQKKLSKNMIIFACAVLAVALIIPIAIMFHLIGEEDPTTTGPVFSPDVQVNASTSPSSTTDPFAPVSTTVPTQVGEVTQSSAVDVSAAETTAPSVSSTSGLFTFYVFGYGHGVGMSQVGANYLAQQGWTAAEILAHYYYDPNTSIISGETYPEKITYNGTQYDTREYLASALESEMGSSFSYEALKAQAIAIYTFAKYNGYNLSQDAHSYGKTPSELCYRVVDEVMNTGYYIAYGNDVAVTPFHAMSAGVTTSYYNVWGKGIGASVPYLAGGRQSYGDYMDSNFKSVYTITSEDLKAIAKDKLNVELSGDPANWLSIVTHDKAVREDIGYVSSINVGGTIITGNEFRIKVMEGKIRSHCFTIVYTPNT